MKIQGAITNVKRPANGDNFGKVSIEHVLMSYPKRLDAFIPEAGEVVAVVSSKWMEGKSGGRPVLRGVGNTILHIRKTKPPIWLDGWLEC